ncbi:MAG: hypothetical protein WCL30_01065 [Pseudomonadota bacterium]
MTNETAIKFAEICGFEKPEYDEMLNVVRSRAVGVDFKPTNADDVLALAIEWCEKNIEDFIRIELLIYSKKELSKDSECGLYLCTILQETDCDSGYGKTMVSVLDGEVFVDGNSPSQAIMLAVIKAAEGLNGK